MTRGIFTISDSVLFHPFNISYYSLYSSIMFETRICGESGPRLAGLQSMLCLGVSLPPDIVESLVTMRNHCYGLVLLFPDLVVTLHLDLMVWIQDLRPPFHIFGGSNRCRGVVRC